MKGILRNYIFHLTSLWLTTEFLPQAITLSGGLVTLLFAAFVLSLFNMLLKPILKLLFLPINALTLGLFTLVINAGVFFLFLKVVPQVSVHEWVFPGFQLGGFAVPETQIPFIGSLFIVSLVLSFIINFYAFLVK